ncbi:MAG: hypothetical protein QW837_06065 [Conexivisphaerales archaeon]
MSKNKVIRSLGDSKHMYVDIDLHKGCLNAAEVDDNGYACVEGIEGVICVSPIS